MHIPSKKLKLGEAQEIEALYQQGLCAQEIKDKLQVDISVRQIQRRLRQAGLTRTMSEAFRLAIKKGRVAFKTNPNKTIRLRLGVKLRFSILERDNFRCVLCGADATDNKLNIDHIDENVKNNDPSNLQVLCEHCNQGKTQKMWERRGGRYPKE